MSDLISRQAAIDTLHMDTSIIPYKKAREYADATILEIRNRLEKLPSAQPKITDCDYCHEDSDGYVTPLEKNCHAFVTYSPIDGWILSLKANGWYGEARIKFCPMCGRRLGGQNR